MCVRICLVFNLRSIDPIFEYFSDFVLNCNNLFADLLNKHIHTKINFFYCLYKFCYQNGFQSKCLPICQDFFFLRNNKYFEINAALNTARKKIRNIYSIFLVIRIYMYIQKQNISFL